MSKTRWGGVEWSGALVCDIDKALVHTRPHMLRYSRRFTMKVKVFGSWNTPIPTRISPN